MVKMSPKSSQKGGPEGSRNGQKSDPEKRSILGPKLDAQGSILRPHWGSLLGFILLHFGGQILIPFRRRSWSAKRVRDDPWQTTWGAALGPEAPWGAPLDMIYRNISLDICGSNTPLGHKGPAN